MAPRGNAPGLKRGRRRLPYWIARQVVRNTMGFPDSCIPLPPDKSDEELAELCRGHTARLYRWIETVDGDGGAALNVPKYDGTVHSACQIYQLDPRSPFHKVKGNTRRSYTGSLKIVEETVGKRLIRKLTVFDVQHWYDQWRKPALHGGAERIKRAHDAVTIFRTVLWFMTALRKSDCKLLAEELKPRKFEKGGAREQEMTFSQTSAFIKMALDLGRKGVMPAARTRSLAIGVAAQFELLLRQKDIIGEWTDSEVAAYQAMRKVVPRRFGSEWWVGQFAWENVPGWRWRVKTSKSKYRAAADFDLSAYALLSPLLESVPHAERVGPIIVDERALPIRETMYRKWFRTIARAAGIPDEVWLMDTRAGGITEAEEAGVDLKVIRDGATHANETTTLRYVRRRARGIADMNEARKRSREGGGDASS